MQHAVLDLGGAALVPELGADVAAGAAGNVQLVLVAVVALGALPNQLAVLLHDADLAVVAAHLAVVALGVQLSVHDVLVDELHHLDDSLKVILHVGHFHVADGTARGQALELALELQLGESVDRLGHMDVVGVGDIVAVGDTGHQAEALLQALGKLVGGGFQRRAVQAEIDVVLLFPLGAGIVHMLHYVQGKGLGGGVGVAFAGHIFAALIQACVTQADGGVTAVQQLVDGFALLQAGQGAVLPQDGGGVAQGALQAVVAAHQGLVAQLQALVKDLPELIKVAAAGQGHIHQVDGDNALVEAAVILGFAVLVHVGGQEAAATHAGEAMALAVFVHLVLQHLLFADVVRYHAFGGALGSQLGQVVVGLALVDIVILQHVDQLGEGGGDPDAGLVLDALVTLAQHFLNDDGQVGLQALVVAGLVQVHEHGDERGLAVGGHQGDDLILDGLHAALDLLTQALFHDLRNFLLAGIDAQIAHLGLDIAADLLAADVHEGGQVGQADALTAVLAGRYLGDDLGGNVAGGGEGMGLLNQRAADDGAVLQHVVQIDQVAVVHVLGVVVGIVEVDDAFLMGLDDLRGQQHTHGQVLADFASHVVALHAVDGGVLVGVLLLDFLVIALDEGEDLVVRRVVGALQALHIAVGDIFTGNLKGAGLHDLILDQVLDLLHVHGVAAGQAAGLHMVADLDDLLFGQTLAFRHDMVGLGNGCNNFCNVEDGLTAVAFDDFHADTPNTDLSEIYKLYTSSKRTNSVWRANLSYRSGGKKSREKTTIYSGAKFRHDKILHFERSNDENAAATTA